MSHDEYAFSSPSGGRCRCGNRLQDIPCLLTHRTALIRQVALRVDACHKARVPAAGRGFRNPQLVRTHSNRRSIRISGHRLARGGECLCAACSALGEDWNSPSASRRGELVGQEIAPRTPEFAFWPQVLQCANTSTAFVRLARRLERLLSERPL